MNIFEEFKKKHPIRCFYEDWKLRFEETYFWLWIINAPLNSTGRHARSKKLYVEKGGLV